MEEVIGSMPTRSTKFSNSPAASSLLFARASGVLGQSVSPLVKQIGDLQQFCRCQTLIREE